MTIIIMLIGLFLIIHEEANKNVLTLTKEQRRHVEIMKPLAQKERQLREDLFNGNYKKYK